MKKTLVIGASPKADRYSYKAEMMLRSYGHETYLFGKQSGLIEGKEINKEWPQDGDFDTVTMYVNPTLQAEMEDAIIKLNPKRVVFNPGTENPSFEEKLKIAGIQPLEACTLVLLSTNQY
ncbi:MAG: CoA-binding protein [Bacteroidia bacterium]